MTDRGIYLRDILVDEKYYTKNTVLRNLLRHKERNEREGRGY
jgi:hypothetical protein